MVVHLVEFRVRCAVSRMAWISSFVVVVVYVEWSQVPTFPFRER